MRLLTLILCSLAYICNVAAYEYNISACCITQNEERFIKEWIDYHRLIGVDHFYIYDNMSNDNSRLVLEPYIQEGIVDYIYWERTYTTEKEWWHVQREAYIDAVERAKDHSKWLAVIDTDEFIVPIQDTNLTTFLEDFDEYGGVCISWVFYGSSGIQTFSPDKWMVTQLLHRAELTHQLNRMVKSIVRPERVDPWKSFFPHTCAYKNGYFHVNADKKNLKKSVVRDYCSQRIRLHHYWARDLDFLYKMKLPRYSRWIGEEKALEKMKIEQEMNKHYDPAILQVIDRNQNKYAP